MVRGWPVPAGSPSPGTPPPVASGGGRIRSSSWSEATGNTHWLHQGFDSPGVGWADAADGVRLGYLEVPPGQSALLLHTDEHGANGIGPGTYAIHRKRTYVPSVGRTPRPQPATRLVED